MSYTNATQNDQFLTAETVGQGYGLGPRGLSWNDNEAYTPYKSGGYNALAEHHTPSDIKKLHSTNNLDFDEPRPFNREEFRVMIIKTYSEFFGKFRDQFNPEDYMEVVDKEELVQRFQAFLENSEENLLTPNNMPVLDLGNVPTTHSFMRTESQQVYYVPKNKNPDMVYVKYSLI